MRPLLTVAHAVTVIFAIMVSMGVCQAANEKPDRPRTIIAGIPKNFPPHYVVRDDGTVTGFAVDVFDAVAKHAGYQVEYRVFSNFGRVTDALEAGKIDLIPNMGITEPRKQFGLFSPPYESFRVNLFIRADDDEITSLNDLKERITGTVTSNIAEALLPRYSNVPPRLYDSANRLLTALLDHEIDVLAYPAPVIEKIARNRKVSAKISRSGPPLALVERGIFVAKDRGALLRDLNASLNEFIVSEKFDQFYERWFGEPEDRSLTGWREFLWAIATILIAASAFAIWRLLQRLLGGSKTAEVKQLEARLWRRLLAIAALIFVVTFGASAAVIFLIYHVTFDEKRAEILNHVENTRQLIDAVARYNRQRADSPEHAREATLAQIRDGLGGVKLDTEIVVGERTGDAIRLILRQKAARLDAPVTLSAPPRGMPMRLAVEGETGTTIAKDYRGISVLAAYAPLRPLNLGLVVKEDMSAIRAPYVEAGWTIALLAVAVGLLGSLGYFTLIMPIIGNVVRSEERFSLAMRGANDGLFDWDVVANTVYYSPRWKSMLGYGDDEIANDFQEWWNRLHPDDLGPAQERLQHFLAQQGSELRSEFRMRHRDGYWVDILARAFGVWDEDGKCIRVIGTHIDVSELRRSEKQVEDYARFAQRNPNPILRIDTNGDILLANPAATKLLDDLALGGSGRFPEADRSAWHDLLQSAKRAKRRNQYQLDFADHSYLFEIVPESDGTAINLYATDITERTRAEEELQILSRGIEDSQSLVIVTDLGGTVEYINPRIEEVLGYGRDELVGQSVKILRPPEHDSEKYNDLWNTVREGKNWRGELNYQTKSGASVLMQMSVSPVHDQDGKPTHFIGINEDITQSRAVEEQLRQSQKLEAVGQLTGGIAHDFNNLLAVIRGNLELIGMEITGQEDLVKHLEAAKSAVVRGADLTARLLAFSRQSKLETGANNLNEVIYELHELLDRSLGERVTLRFRPFEGLWQTTVNRSQLENAIINVCNNARDAMPDGGMLTIETRNTYLDEAYAAQNVDVKPGEYVMVAFMDEGTGMPPDVVERIFEPFFTTKSEGKGSGLGMSMVYGFVKQSGGHAKIHSEVGRGTTVRIYLPRNTESAVAAEPSQASEPERAEIGNAVILVVEDQESVRTIVTEMLEKLKCQVNGVESGRQALKILESDVRVDVLFTDVVMPEMSGFELAQKARQLRPDLKVLFTSGFADNAIAKSEHLQAGADLITKPYSMAELANKIQQILNQ